MENQICISLPTKPHEESDVTEATQQHQKNSYVAKMLRMGGWDSVTMNFK